MDQRNSFIYICVIISLLGQSYGQEESLFFAGRDRPLEQSEVIVRYPVIDLNVGVNYDPLSSIYTAPDKSLTVFLSGTGTFQGAVLDYSLRQTTALVTGIYSTNTAFNGHVSLSRMQLVGVEEGQTLSTHMDSFTKLFSSPHMDTYFSGFSMDAEMDIVSGFSAGRTSNQGTEGVIQFDTINVDTDLGYNSMTGEYTIPQTGTYYVSASISVPANQPAAVSIVNSLLGNLLLVESTSTNHNGPIVATNAMMFTLVAGSRVSARLNSGQLYGDENQGISLNLFYYSLSNSNNSAWSVYCLDDHTAQGGDISPYPFEGAYVNLNAIWDFHRNRAVIQKRGTYMIHINAGSVAGAQTVIQLYAGNLQQWYVGMSQNSSNTDGWSTFGRDVLVQLLPGDEVYTRLVEGTSAHSYLAESVSITGFLVQPF